MDQELSRFLTWIENKLNHVDFEKRKEIIAAIQKDLEETQTAQQVPFDSIIYQIKDKVQYINGFLMKSGERPIRNPRSPLKVFLITIVALVVLGIGAASYLFYKIESSFEINQEDGVIKLFGQTLDFNKMDMNVQINDGFDKKFVRKQETGSNFKMFSFDLDDTSTVVSFTEEDRYSLECDINVDNEVEVSGTGNERNIKIASGSSCEVVLPESATIDFEFKNGKLTLDRPKASFSVDAENGMVRWIKRADSKYQLVYDVRNGGKTGSHEEIFYANARSKANIELDNGMLMFINP